MTMINTNLDGSYMNEDQILADLSNRITDPETLDVIRSNFTPKPNADQAEAFSVVYAATELGRWNRNSYGLWREDNPYTLVNPEPNEDGIIDHPLHPDNLSGRIIDRFVAQSQNDPLTTP